MGASEMAASRRQFLLATTAAAGAAVLLGRDTFARAANRDHAMAPRLRPNIGAGKSVAVIGAGIAGLTSSYYLAKAGFEVTVFEANNRYGGRSLTLRPEAEIYKKYNKERYGIGEDSYADRFQENGGPLQICRFFDDGWDRRPGTYPEELFLNAGPGRIPSFHIAVLNLARELNVEMEPFIFATRANLLQSDKFNEGQPIQLRRIKHDLRGEISDILAKLAGDGKLAPYLGTADRQSFLRMIKEFGDLKGDPEEAGRNMYYAGTNRAGYAVLPGAGRRPGKLHPHVGLEEILASRFWNEAIFHDMRSYWQTSLLQPRGGMDMLWQRLLKQRVGVDGGRRVQDLVKLGNPVTAIANVAEGSKVKVEWSGRRPGNKTFDFCISTMAPNLLAQVRNNFTVAFTEALAQVNEMAACKVGWQARYRFWETETRIYGGISWTKLPISQIWYPSDGFFNRTGTLTGAYNRGEPAAKFGELSHHERLESALQGGGKLHANFRDKVYADRGVSIAWQNMPHFAGGWADETAESQPDIYRRITNFPQGRVFLAGDFVSYMPGWMEGAVRSAHLAVEGIAGQVSISKG